MNWESITVETTTEAVEAVAALLLEFGAEGTQIEDAADFADGYKTATGEWFDPSLVPHRQTGAAVTGYFAREKVTSELLGLIEKRVAQLSEFGLNPGTGKVAPGEVASVDWANEWKKYYQPLRLTRYLTIVPEWLDYTPAQVGEVIIRLDPGEAFGTGGHPTTAIMLQLLEQVIRGGETMIDVGTGSGVLAIAARRLGVARVLATDVDQIAVDNALSNIALNPVEQITVRTADLLVGVDERADLITANILAEVLLPLIPQAATHLNDNGQLLLSGIFYDKIETILNSLAEVGLTVQRVLHIGDWYGVCAQRAVAE